MNVKAIEQFERDQMKKDLPDFRPGDTLRVNMKVVEGDRERIQAYEGICIARKGGGINETFKVRKVSYGVGVERTFPLHSPQVDSIEVRRRGHVRRAKLYYLRERTGKKARVRSKRQVTLQKMLPEYQVAEPQQSEPTDTTT